MEFDTEVVPDQEDAKPPSPLSGGIKRKRHQTLISFEDSFGPLAYHLFPDGCPTGSTSNGSSITTGILESVWPQPKSRAVVSAKDALAAMKQLYRRAKHVGFTSSGQQEALVVVASGTLVLRHNSQPTAEETFLVKNSPLRDGSSHHFQTLVRSIIPQQKQPISSFVVMKLLVCCRNRQIDCLGICCVLQFLTLAIRNGALSLEARQTLSRLYAVIFQWTMDGNLCADAVRLLHAITRRGHVKAYRAERLREFYMACTPNQQYNFAPLWLLLQLYARYDPQGCGEYFPTPRRDLKGYSRWFALPDTVWERSFNTLWNRGAIDDSTTETPNNQNDSSGAYSMPDLEHIQKRRKTSSTVLDTLDRLEVSFEGVHSFSSSFGPNKTSLLRASDLLKDSSLMHLMLLEEEEEEELPQASASALVASHEASRVKVCLPFMLQEEWYQTNPAMDKKAANLNSNITNARTMLGSGSDNDGSSADSGEGGSEAEHGENDGVEEHVHQQTSYTGSRSASRLRLLGALALTAVNTNKIEAGAETLILDDILRTWDGTDEWGVMLCYDILPCVSGCTSFPEIRNKILNPMEKVFLYGTPRLQHAIVSGTLASLLAHLITQNNPIDRKTIREFIQWTDDVLLQGFLMGTDEGTELLSGAVVDFFCIVCLDVPRHCSFIVLPSASLVYRLLLNRSPVSIDRACQLLVDYKDSFRKLKELEGQKASEKTSVEGLDQVAVFNCFVWDFCSVLWRNSPLPSSPSDNNDMARKLSILFTSIESETLSKLNNAPEKANIPSALSITHGAVFAPFSSGFIRRNPPKDSNEGVLSPDVLEGKLKQEYLDYLKHDCGMRGVHTFLTSFVSSLAKREQRKQKKSTNMLGGPPMQ